MILLNKLNHFIFYSKTCAVVIYWTGSLLLDIQNTSSFPLLQIWLYCMSLLTCVNMKDWHLEWQSCVEGGDLCIVILVLVEAPDCLPQGGGGWGSGAPQALLWPFPSQPPVFGACGVLSHVLALCFVIETAMRGSRIFLFVLIILVLQND